jgi:hypothetical protein
MIGTQTEFTLDGEPLSVCATNRLKDALSQGSLFTEETDAIRAELATRIGPAWPPYGGLCTR